MYYKNLLWIAISIFLYNIYLKDVVYHRIEIVELFFWWLMFGWNYFNSNLNVA